MTTDTENLNIQWQVEFPVKKLLCIKMIHWWNIKQIYIQPIYVKLTDLFIAFKEYNYSDTKFIILVLISLRFKGQPEDR